jgi:hypothetical protein
MSGRLKFVLACIVLASTACGRHTSDAELELIFSRHEQQFQRLLAMVQADAAAKKIGPRYVSQTRLHYGETEHHGLSEERWIQYQGLLSELGIEGVASDARRASFRIDLPSIQNGDSDKGFLYSETPLEPSAADLDGYKISPSTRTKYGDYLAYKKIRPNWYLYVHYN